MFPASFLDAAMTKYIHKLRNDEHNTDAAKSQEPFRPKALKAAQGGMKWLENHLGKLRGAPTIYLECIFLDYFGIDNDMRDTEYGSVLQHLNTTTRLDGILFDIDNA